MNESSVILACSACNAKNRIPLTRLDDAPICGKCQTPLPVDDLSRPVDVSDQNFDQVVLASPIPVMVDCWAPWCGPCRSISPMMVSLARKYRARIKIAKLNLDENTMIGSRYSITSVPTFLLIQNGRIVDKLVGALPKEHLEAAVERIL